MQECIKQTLQNSVRRLLLRNLKKWFKGFSFKPLNPGPLLSHEWLVVALFSFSILFLTFYTQWSAKEGRFSYLNPSKPLVLLSITGEVRDSGLYNVEKGKTLREALEMAGLPESADLSKIDLGERVEGPRKLIIKAKREKKGKSGNKH